jgi:hypothetical protein
MLLFHKSYLTNKKKNIVSLYGTIQLNICFKVSFNPDIPFTFELGLGLFTILLEIYKTPK